MLLTFKFKWFKFSIFICRIQTIKGICSKVVKENKHYILWEFDKAKKQEVIETLQKVQEYYKLADIFIFSDKEDSYHAHCFSKRTFKQYLEILLHTDYLEWNFIRWAILRGKSTLRTSQKYNRQPQQLIDILEGYEEYKIPKKLNIAIYETGINKIRGKSYG